MVRTVKITVVGDGTVGKTCMLIAYTSKVFNEKYIPTVFENYADKITLEGEEFNMALWDTAGQEDYERLRPLSYPNTTCFLICYSVSHKTSYENVRTKWAPELRHYMPHIPIILIGTKADLRKADDPSLILLTEKDGQKMKREIKADAYYECSAKEMTGLDAIFEAAVYSSIKKTKKQKKRDCSIL